MNPGTDKHLNKEFGFDVYSETLAEVASQINLNHLQSVLDLLVRARETKATIFLCGNGGSASNAMHLANDMIFGAVNSNGVGLSVHALPSNQSIMTCLANDIDTTMFLAISLVDLQLQVTHSSYFSGSGNSKKYH